MAARLPLTPLEASFVKKKLSYLYVNNPLEGGAAVDRRTAEDLSNALSTFNI
jgi:hypothetical protein